MCHTLVICLVYETYIFIVPLGPKFVFKTSCKPLAALMFTASAWACLAISAFGFKETIAAIILIESHSIYFSFSCKRKLYVATWYFEKVVCSHSLQCRFSHSSHPSYQYDVIKSRRYFIFPAYIVGGVLLHKSVKYAHECWIISFNFLVLRGFATLRRNNCRFDIYLWYNSIETHISMFIVFVVSPISVYYTF